MNWRSHLPQHCPPEDAQDAFGEMYRLTSNNPPQAEDFLSWREESPENDLPKGVSECQACGLSVYRNKEDALSIIKRIPRFKKSKPAMGTLEPSLGKILSTPSRSGKSHHTWWVYSNTQPWAIFNVNDVEQLMP